MTADMVRWVLIRPDGMIAWTYPSEDSAKADCPQGWRVSTRTLSELEALVQPDESDW